MLNEIKIIKNNNLDLRIRFFYILRQQKKTIFNIQKMYYNN